MKIRRMRVLTSLLSIATLLPAQQYVFRAYRQSDGLKNLAVRSLAKDCEGYLWLATENGVFRFTGSGFEHFSREQGLAELGVQEIVADGGCNVWAGTTQNLYRFDGQRFVPATQNPIRVLNTHGMAAQDGRHLLVIDNGRLYQLEHGPQDQSRSYRPVFSVDIAKAFPGMGELASVSVIHEPSGGTHIWMGAGSKLYSWSNTANDSSTEASQPNPSAISEWGIGNGLPDDHWESVVVDPFGTLWAEGQRHIVALPRGASKFVDRSISTSAQGNFFLRSRLVVDRDGRVLAPTDDGVARWEGTGWKNIDRSRGVPRNNQVGAMIFDGSGDLWIGSYGDGLYNWAGYQEWEGWGDDKGLPSSIIWAIDSSKPERVIVGTDKGPAWIEPGSGATGALANGKKWLFGLIVAMGREHDGWLWAATNSGNILRVNDHTGQIVPAGKLPASILSGFEDSTGRLFLGTDHGIYVRDAAIAKGEPQQIAAANALIHNSALVNAGCHAPDGTNWFLAGNSLLRERAGQWSEVPADGLPGPKGGRLIALSCARNGELWVTGQRIGPWRLTPAGDTLKAWHLEAPQELHGIESYAILADHRGWIWLGTDQGLLVWNGASWRHLTQESGMLSNDVDQWALSESADGSLWIGTSGGAAHLLHPERVFNANTLPLSITGIHRGTTEFLPGSGIDVPWSPQPLSFQMSSPAVRNRSELVFKYQIEGLHSGWIESPDGLAVLSGIAPGKYWLMAMATNSGLNANSPIMRLRVIIRPPWWRRIWFVSFAVIAFVCLLMLMTRLYAGHVRSRSRHLEELVRQRTKELEDSRELLRIQATFDGLTGMLNRSAILAELSVQMDRARQSGKPLILALTDVDHFKEVNDTYGHLTGDEALRRFAAALRFSIRTTDRVGRYGGEEFLVLLTDVPSELAENRLTHLHAAISTLRVRVGDDEIKINCSIGGTVFDPRGENVDAEFLLSHADQALYAAKAAGRNRVVFTRARKTVG